MKDRRARRMAFDDPRLALIEGDDLIRREALEIHQMRWIGLGDGHVRQFDLVEASIVHRPEDIPPGFIQRFDAAIFGFAPSAKRPQRRLRIAQHGVVAAIFIVGLPSGDGGMRAESLRQTLDDAVAFLRVAFMAETIVPARTEFARPPISVERRHIRHLVDKPFWRRRGWGSQHDLEAGAIERIDSLGEPSEIIDAVAGLQPRPGEFADTHEGKTYLLHHGRVLAPA